MQQWAIFPKLCTVPSGLTHSFFLLKKYCTTQPHEISFFFFPFPFPRAAPGEHGSSLARDWIATTAITYTTAAASLDPELTVLGHGLNPRPLSNPSCCSQILNPLCHSGISHMRFIIATTASIWTGLRKINHSQASLLSLLAPMWLRSSL